uniref:G protein subunit gamma 13 n=1 Tax=Anas platyrhynchos TaxID=8839 RepID=A0A8B9TQE1_ANAPL
MGGIGNVPRSSESTGMGRGAAWGHSTDTLPFSPHRHCAEPPPSPGAMDEWDLPQWKKEVESLKYQLAYKREMSSKTIPEFVKWIEDGIPEDPFLNPELMKNNPWVEKGKCSIL